MRRSCMRRDDLYVADLADTTRAIREYLDSISRAQWDEDRVLRDAVLYRLLLLGEIASALPELLRDRYPDVAWRHIRAFRNLAVFHPTSPTVSQSTADALSYLRLFLPYPRSHGVSRTRGSRQLEPCQRWLAPERSHRTCQATAARRAS